MARIRFDDWEKNRFSRWFPYIQSKLAGLLFTSELQRRAAAGFDLLAVAAHPGYAATMPDVGPGDYRGPDGFGERRDASR